MKPIQWLIDYMNGNSDEKSDRVIPEKALTSAAFFYGVRKISNNFGMLPCSLYRRRGDTTTIQESHPSHTILKSTPNIYQVPSIWKQQHMNHAICWGNGRSFILRDQFTGKPLELIPLMPDRTITYMQSGEKVHVCKPLRDDRFDLMTDMRRNPEEVVTLHDSDVLHTMGFTLDGIEGISLVKMASITIAGDLAADKHGLSQVKKGYSGGLVLEAQPGDLRDEAKATEFLQQWRETNDGEDNARKTVLLRNGMKATVLSMSNSDAQVFEGRKFTRQQIALWLGLESILGDDNSVSYKSLEQKVLAYLMNCLGAWLTQFEEQAAAKMLTEKERKNGFYYKFNDGALLRSDKTATAEFVSKLIASTVISRNEARAMFDMNPVEGGDEYQNPATTAGEPEPNAPGPTKPKTTKEPTTNVLEAGIRNLIKTEAKRANDLTKSGNFALKAQQFYTRWQSSFADRLEEFGLDRDLARIHCEESMRQLTEIAAKTTTETLRNAVETCTKSWINRTKPLTTGLKTC